MCHLSNYVLVEACNCIGTTTWFSRSKAPSGEYLDRNSLCHCVCVNHLSCHSGGTSKSKYLLVGKKTDSTKTMKGLFRSLLPTDVQRYNLCNI